MCCKLRAYCGLMIGMAVLCCAAKATAQGYGSDLQTTMAPASGGMAGVSVARPQDVPSAIFGNPAALTQFAGTQASFGGAWIEGYPTIANDGSLNAGTPFTTTSRSQGFVAPQIGITQNFEIADRSATFGVGLGSLSGIGAEYRGRAPNTILDNFSSQYVVLGLNTGLGVQITDRLSLGASGTLGTAFEQLGFVGPLVGSAMVTDYALRGTVGLNYNLNERNTVGAYWQSPMSFQFSNAVRFLGNYQDLRVEQPGTVGLGWANRALMNGNLLLAADVYFKDWSHAELWQNVMVNQWAFAFGAQYTLNAWNYRLGYSYNTNPLRSNVGDILDGFPILQQNVQLFQAGSAPFVNQNRLTFGVGRRGLFSPNLDVDMFAGGLFHASQNFGPNTSASLAVYYIGAGLTYRFRNGSPRP